MEGPCKPAKPPAHGLGDHRADRSRLRETPNARKRRAALPAPDFLQPTAFSLSARRIFKQRRSAQAVDSAASIQSQVFYHMLGRLLPHAHVTPWHSILAEPRIHLCLFVHRVEALPRGIYGLVRDVKDVGRFQAALDPSFVWKRPPGCPEALPFYLLREEDYTDVAAHLSCQQEIAGCGVFSLAMLARFAEALEARGPWMYPRLFWEAGMVGHVLYLEAEAAGLRGTGLGCYFDDAVHRLLGIKDDAYQSLYHFTVGRPVQDPRLQSAFGKPPYTKKRLQQP